MTNDEMQAALSLFMEQAEGEMGDPHELLMRLKQLMDGLRAVGMPVPDDLSRMEQELTAELAGPAPDTAAP